MRRVALSRTVEIVVIFVMCVALVSISMSLVKGNVGKGETIANRAGSVNGTSVTTQCGTFCMGYNTKTPDEQKNAKCNTILCSGKYYQYTCEGDVVQCADTCRADKQIPPECNHPCNFAITSIDCNTTLENLIAAGKG